MPIGATIKRILIRGTILGAVTVVFGVTIGIGVAFIRIGFDAFTGTSALFSERFFWFCLLAFAVAFAVVTFSEFVDRPKGR
jgi:hypothetical protein